MNPAELVSQLAMRSFEPPLSELRDSEAITDLSNPVSVLMLLMDFETEVTMSGIEGFLGNSTGRYARETAAALDAVGRPDEAQKLREILDVAAAAGMTYKAMQEEGTGLEEYDVVSFTGVHGDKWEEALEQISSLADGIDFRAVVQGMEEYVVKHQSRIEPAIAPEPQHRE